LVGHVNEAVVSEMLGVEKVSFEHQTTISSESAPESDRHDDEPPSSDDEPPSSNQGQLILDATCAPADTRYPTDLSVLNEARENSEDILDALYLQVSDQFKTKPRTYRKLARKAFL
jgi:transposase, IS5 family